MTAGLRGETTLDGHAQNKNFIPICNNLQNLSKSLKESVSLGEIITCNSATCVKTWFTSDG